MCYYNSTHHCYVIKVLNSPPHIAFLLTHFSELPILEPLFAENFDGMFRGMFARGIPLSPSISSRHIIHLPISTLLGGQH